MKKLPYILIAAIVLFTTAFLVRLGVSAPDKPVDYPICVAFPPNLDSYMGPIGKNYSISWEVLFEGNPHRLSVWCSEYAEHEAQLHFMLSGPGPANSVETEQIVKINPSAENTLTLFESLIVSTKPKL